MTMQTQDIFKAFGSNWKWASISSTGRARIYTGKPAILGSLIQSPVDELVSRCEAFDVPTPANGIVPQIWERTDFSNGPAYETDKFGIPLPVDVPSAPPARGYCDKVDCFNEKAVGFNVCEVHRPAPQTRLTTEEAENGKLWDFAKVHENYVLVDALGGVHFSSDVVGVPRYAFDVVVDGVTHPIERKRSQPKLAPPEAGKPFSGAEKPWPSPELQKAYQSGESLAPDEDVKIDEDTSHGWFDRVDELEKELAKAKSNAAHLLKCYQADGNSVALTRLQYMAIFGEQPE